MRVKEQTLWAALKSLGVLPEPCVTAGTWVVEARGRVVQFVVRDGWVVNCYLGWRVSPTTFHFRTDLRPVSLASAVRWLLNNSVLACLPHKGMEIDWSFHFRFAVKWAASVREAFMVMRRPPVRTGQVNAENCWLLPRDIPVAVRFATGNAGAEVLDYFQDEYPLVRKWVEESYR